MEKKAVSFRPTTTIHNLTHETVHNQTLERWRDVDIA